MTSAEARAVLASAQSGAQVELPKADVIGIDVTCTRYNGLIHDYGLLNAISHVPGVRAAIRQASEQLKRHLQ